MAENHSGTVALGTTVRPQWPLNCALCECDNDQPQRLTVQPSSFIAPAFVNLSVVLRLQLFQLFHSLKKAPRLPRYLN